MKKQIEFIFTKFKEYLDTGLMCWERRGRFWIKIYLNSLWTRGL